MLKVTGLHVSYDSLAAVRGISIDVSPGEIVTLIGANGAGKTSTLKAVMGLLPAASGRVMWEGDDITRLRPHRRVARGITLCPEGRGVLTSMTVQENLDLGGYLHSKAKDHAERLDQIYRRFPRLVERRGQLAGTLSGGEQQMLAVCRALMCRPKLLLMDEPTLGLAPRSAADVMAAVQEIGDSGVGVLLVEQNVRYALSVSSRAYVMENGVTVLSGPAADLLHDDRVRGIYLGGHAPSGVMEA